MHVDNRFGECCRGYFFLDLLDFAMDSDCMDWLVDSVCMHLLAVDSVASRSI